MESSPAYATTEFKTKFVMTIGIVSYNTIILINNRSNIELVYDATGSETPTPRALPPTIEYEVLTVK